MEPLFTGEPHKLFLGETIFKEGKSYTTNPYYYPDSTYNDVYQDLKAKCGWKRLSKIRRESINERLELWHTEYFPVKESLHHGFSNNTLEMAMKYLTFNKE